MRLVYEDIMVRSFELFFNPTYPCIAYVRKKKTVIVLIFHENILSTLKNLTEDYNIETFNG